MQTRVAVIAIVVENPNAVEQVNRLLHEAADYILGRMGLPYRERGINLISVAIDAPPSAGLNTAKRVYRILVPNRVFYGVFCFLPLFPAAMPLLYAGLLRAMLKTNAAAHFYGPPDPVYALLTGLACALPFFLLLRAQKEEKMDLFRLYKA